MKKVQSVLCALVLALSLSSSVFAGNINSTTQNANGILVSDVKANGILVSDLFTWGEITGVIVSVFGVVLGDQSVRLIEVGQLVTGETSKIVQLGEKQAGLLLALR